MEEEKNQIQKRRNHIHIILMIQTEIQMATLATLTTLATVQVVLVDVVMNHHLDKRVEMIFLTLCIICLVWDHINSIVVVISVLDIFHLDFQLIFRHIIMCIINLIVRIILINQDQEHKKNLTMKQVK